MASPSHMNLIVSSATSSFYLGKAKSCVLSSSPTMLPKLNHANRKIAAAPCKMVHYTVAQGQGKDNQGCLSASIVQTDTHVQFSRIQRYPIYAISPLQTCVVTDAFKGQKKCESAADRCLYLTDSKVVYRRYASLFFIAGCASTDNELITLEIVHRYVEQMDKYYGNVCELDIIFNFQKAYFILDELLLAGEMQESSKKNVLRCISQEDSLEDMEVSLTLLAQSQLSLARKFTTRFLFPCF